MEIAGQIFYRRVAGAMVMNAHRRRVLVADCHDDTLIILEKLLEDAGFDTTTVWTAKDALRLVDSHVFDLVLVNKCLPDAECEELLKNLRERCESVACIVMLPSEPDITDFTHLETLGARAVVCKRAYRRIIETVGECLACNHESRSTA
jgi:DNA-binding response OmpR family regulator